MQNVRLQRTYVGIVCCQVDCTFLLIVCNQLIVYYFSYGKYIMSVVASELIMAIDKQ